MLLSRRYFVIVLALVLVASRGVFIGSPWSAETIQKEVFTFAADAGSGAADDDPIDVEATLFLPKHAKQPWSAVVIVPSSGGVEDEREIYYATELAKSGIAAVVVDSFTARGVTDTLYDQSALESWDMENDALEALRWLSRDKRFKSKRIAIMGVSKGGTVARDTALLIRRKWLDASDVAFAAHIAISPDCVWTNRSNRTTKAPIFFMLAELDDQTPPAPCLEQAARFRAEGNQIVETKVYTGAHHAWEELGVGPEFDEKIENYSQCRIWIEDDGRMFAAATGEYVPDGSWRAWAKNSCMTKGATCCGGTPELKEAATKDIIDFLRRHRF